MRLISIEETMGAKSYTPPVKAQQLMADFYCLQVLKGGEQYTPSYRQDNLDFNLKHVELLLLPAIRDHLLAKLGYCIVDEARHIFIHAQCVHPCDNTTKYLQELGMHNTTIQYLKQNSAEMFIDTRSLTPEIIKDCIIHGTVFFRNSWEDDLDPGMQWGGEVGGTMWMFGCYAWIDLYNAKDPGPLTIVIDHIYDLEHNTGAMLNHDREYWGTWPKRYLDLKRKANPEELIHRASPFLQSLGIRILRANFGRSYYHEVG